MKRGCTNIVFGLWKDHTWKGEENKAKEERRGNDNNNKKKKDLHIQRTTCMDDGAHIFLRIKYTIYELSRKTKKRKKEKETMKKYKN